MIIQAIEIQGSIIQYCVFETESSDTPLACFTTELECEQYIQQ